MAPSKQPEALYRVEPDGVAVVTLSYPPLNALHPQSPAHLGPAAHPGPLLAGGRRCAPRSCLPSPVRPVPLFPFPQVLEGGPKPTVAAVQGVALGGGLELAMGCNARVAAPGTTLGLPELQLGIIPGFGGTQRLPRLVGLSRAASMMLTSTPIKAEAGLKAGLVDQVAPPEQLLAAARAYALDIAEGRRARMYSLTRTGAAAWAGFS
ncbi:Glyoxysomal fatty acid beta-oxidation multifunctional protein MFP-a [Tetrabaena socialis]|uniref:Glyoxysomal fatty acid beta-oxidation multifunctional protein MFP-a n=1 Tax=Tetrabaena socialis TaxID=47790 RepID=A0A2J7ZTN0_9CHLO|nr:Glyoxysomal fatty acid beta-oxidation multifunctional protein MFP-a [Tetrabaena socialis]|eukprot:PNH03627.1 Glyoxysomal fatty acid beta-oxidation multifunctional protein MFP-a [Tetrabaena socialis]